MTDLSSSPPTSAPVAATAIPFKSESHADTAGLAGSSVAIVLVLLVAAVVAALLRRKMNGWPPRGGERLINVVESRRIGERMRLSVVHYRDRELLIAHADQSATVLVNAPAAPANGAAR